MKYRDERFYWSYQHGVHWPDDYLGPDSMTWWIIEGQWVLQMWVCLRSRKVSGLMYI